MKRVFVCSALRAPDPRTVREHLDTARALCREAALAGDAPFAPHLLYPQFLDDRHPRERDLGIACGLAWLAAADRVHVFGTPTEGMARELAEARRLGTEVRFVS